MRPLPGVALRATRLAAALAASALALGAYAQSAPTTLPDDLAEAEAFALGYQAYVMGAVYVRSQLLMEKDTHPNAALNAPLNQFNVYPGLATPATAIDFTPNNDTVYGLAWLDLRQGPVLMTIPGTPERYWTVQATDWALNTLDYVGERVGSKAGTYAYVPPGWKGKLPEGVTRIDSTTTGVFLQARTVVQPEVASDIAPVVAQLKTYRLEPLNKAAAYPRADPASPVPNPKLNNPVWQTLEFYSLLNRAWAFGGVREQDKEVAKLARALGIGPGLTFDPARLTEAQRRGLERAAQAGFKRVIAKSRENGELRNGWRYATNIGRYGEEDPALEGSPFDLDSFDADLAPLFVVSSASQSLRPVAVNRNLPLTAPYAPAAEAALQTGSDLRTTYLEDGTALRLLTYRLPTSGPPQVIQVGRTLEDQQRVLDGLLRMLAVLGGAGALALASGSWWLAGKSLLPAQRAWEKQQSFVANASHELRAPLTLVRASAEVAQRQLPTDDSRRALLNDVLSEVDHMAALVDDLLLLSRLDAGRLHLERARLDVRSLLEELERSVGRVAEASQVTFSTTAEDGLTLMVDPTRARQVLLVLLDNALQHTPPGGSVHMDARRMASRVRIDVRDTGPGIDPQDLPHVFERFFRSNQRGVESNTGLGLAIAKGLVEAQGGTISLENALPTGTLARLEFPGG